MKTIQFSLIFACALTRKVGVLNVPGELLTQEAKP